MERNFEQNSIKGTPSQGTARRLHKQVEISGGVAFHVMARYINEGNKKCDILFSGELILLDCI